MMDRATPNPSRSATAALPIALILPLLALFAGISKGLVDDTRYSVMSVFIALAAVIAGGFVLLTRSRLARAGASASAHLLAWVPVLFFSARSALDTTIVYRPDERMHCGTGEMALLMFAVPVGCIILLVSGGGASILFTRRTTNTFLRAGAITSIVLSLLGLGMAAARLGKPEPDRYLATLKPIATLHVNETVVVEGRSVTLGWAKTKIPPRPVGTNGPEGGAPDAGGANGDDELGNTSHDGPPIPSGECTIGNLESETFAYIDKPSSCPEIRFDRDPFGDIVVTHTRHPGASWMVSSAYRLPTWERIEVSPKSIAPRLSMPIGWALGSMVSSLAAVVFFAGAMVARRRASRFRGVDGVHRGDGWVELANGETVKVPAAERLLVGPVVLSDATEHAPTYRETGSPTFTSASAGTIEDARGTLTDREASLYGLAFAIAALGFAPIVAARFTGLL